ncbi:unnamed protein product [Rotaria socialis]|uniref:Uncharacterized protein n=1 Tax=Rotaria socialis TaxID=392032 RepID=A0A817V1V3_9BILA|nr:unnamed protein product [Rotaria socialis]
MSFLISWSIFLFALIPRTNGINCISCVGWSNSGCNDPYDESTSGDLPVPGNTYCLKVVYPTYVERMAGGRTCTAGAGVGSSVRYCCSDTDYCNRAPQNIRRSQVFHELIMKERRKLNEKLLTKNETYQFGIIL